MELETVEMEWNEVPVCKCGRYFDVCSGAGVWRCSKCDREECLKRWELTKRILKQREKINGQK